MVLATHAVRSHACLLFPHSACEPTTRSPGTLGRYDWSSSRAKRREGPESAGGHRHAFRDVSAELLRRIHPSIACSQAFSQLDLLHISHSLKLRLAGSSRHDESRALSATHSRRRRIALQALRRVLGTASATVPERCRDACLHSQARLSPAFVSETLLLLAVASLRSCNLSLTCPCLRP